MKQVFLVTRINKTQNISWPMYVGDEQEAKLIAKGAILEATPKTGETGDVVEINVLPVELGKIIDPEISGWTYKQQCVQNKALDT